jgi:hypothetical protein
VGQLRVGFLRLPLRGRREKTALKKDECMGKTLIRTLLFLATSLWLETGHALDSYRFLHVTIDTPWLIFLFLLVAIFSPFILMAALA